MELDQLTQRWQAERSASPLSRVQHFALPACCQTGILKVSSGINNLQVRHCVSTLLCRGRR